MFTTWSITWLLVSTRPDDEMIIPVPATWPLPFAVVALISTVAASTFAIAEADAELPPVRGAGLLLGTPPLLPSPLGRVAGELCVSAELVTAHAVPPPAARQTTASPAMSIRRNVLERPPRGVVGGHGGGPYAGLDDQWP